MLYILRGFIVIFFMLFFIGELGGVEHPLSNLYFKDMVGKLSLNTNPDDNLIQYFTLSDPKTGEVNNIPAVKILEELILLKIEKYDVIKLKGAEFSLTKGGSVDVDYLYNGLTNKRKKIELYVTPEFELYREDEKIKGMTFIENSIFGKTVGIKKILFNKEASTYFESFFSLRWDGKHAEYSEWTDLIYKTIKEKGKDLLSTEVEDGDRYYDGYNYLEDDQKINFWAYLFSSVVQLESYFNPESYYRENFRDNNGKYIVSRGLFQLSIESGRGYGCDIPTEQSLHDYRINIVCAVTIMNRWVKRDKRIGSYNLGHKGGARYWAVLRGSKRTKIQNWTKNIKL